MSRDHRIPLPLAGLVAWLVALTLIAVAPPQAGAVVWKVGTSIFGGKVTTDAAYPWTVSIVPAGAPAYSDHFCGGTIVATNRVLTAAHCIDPTGPYQAQPSSLEVIVKQTSLCAGQSSSTWPASAYCTANDTGPSWSVGSRIAVTSISLHPQADVSHYYDDVALLTLAQDVDPSLVVPLADPSGADTPDLTPGTAPEGWGAGTPTYVFGWGTESSGATTQPTVMRMAGGSALPRVADSTCARSDRLGSDFRASDMLCAGSADGIAPNPDACQGDSGGPLLKAAKTLAPAAMSDSSYWRLVGVVSWGEGCAIAKYPGVYAKVGAQSIHDYILEPDPPAMPDIPDLVHGSPTITGTYAQNGSISCDAGTWTDATSYEFSIWKDDGDGLRNVNTEPQITTTVSADGRTATHALTNTEIAANTKGKTVAYGCRVTARGPGGYAAFSAAAAAFDAQVSLTPPPGATNPVVATPTPTPAPVDNVKPVISKSSLVCSSRSCRVALVVLDKGNGIVTSGLSTVTFQLYVHRRTTCVVKGHRKACVKTVVKTVRAKRSADQYILQLGKLKTAEKPKLRVTATDKAGNRKVWSLSLKPRTSR